MTGRIVEWFYAATSVMLAPVLALLTASAAATLWMLGDLAREAWDRRHAAKAWRRFLHERKAGLDGLEEFHRLPLVGYPARFRAALGRDGLAGPSAKKSLDDLEIDMARRLSWLSFATRVGPMLGLVATLLPLGPALRGLESNNLGTLARELEIAFTSTVFGLLIGGLAYAAGLVRRNWYDQDLSDLEYLVGLASKPADTTPDLLPVAEADDV